MKITKVGEPTIGVEKTEYSLQVTLKQGLSDGSIIQSSLHSVLANNRDCDLYFKGANARFDKKAGTVYTNGGVVLNRYMRSNTLVDPALLKAFKKEISPAQNALSL